MVFAGANWLVVSAPGDATGAGDGEPNVGVAAGAAAGDGALIERLGLTAPICIERLGLTAPICIVRLGETAPAPMALYRAVV